MLNLQHYSTASVTYYFYVIFSDAHFWKYAKHLDHYFTVSKLKLSYQPISASDDAVAALLLSPTGLRRLKQPSTTFIGTVGRLYCASPRSNCDAVISSDNTRDRQRINRHDVSRVETEAILYRRPFSMQRSIIMHNHSVNCVTYRMLQRAATVDDSYTCRSWLWVGQAGIIPEAQSCHPSILLNSHENVIVTYGQTFLK